jgi:hypothetical protein
VRNVNASCVRSNLIAVVQAHHPSCWQACLQPHNMTSDCWIECLLESTGGSEANGVPAMTKAQLTAPFEAAFASDVAARGGCPEVKVPTH